ncbi:SHOCT domain-containing protein [Halocatena pleomorpha]|uniref:SHOCT domain-containing protein n=1 Tax=Halocatena pleomorpha TaxID=1785090 RepID=A0A3P3RF98_9EURY|nr:SHOCT domain-containing protein [Halocatena pleomorpha]RRJ32034.1 SHOCT domain-containing protein [Halocatena pleomorpha]
MNDLRKRAKNRLDEIVSLLVLGGGFAAMFTGIEQFDLIWILEFVVLVPLISILTDGRIPATLDDDYRARPLTATEPMKRRDQSADGDTSFSTQDALTTLRERYARWDLTDEQFDRKLTQLIETDTPENAVEWHERTERETETER